MAIYYFWLYVVYKFNGTQSDEEKGKIMTWLKDAIMRKYFWLILKTKEVEWVPILLSMTIILIFVFWIKNGINIFR